MALPLQTPSLNQNNAKIVITSGRVEVMPTEPPPHTWNEIAIGAAGVVVGLIPTTFAWFKKHLETKQGMEFKAKSKEVEYNTTRIAQLETQVADLLKRIDTDQKNRIDELQDELNRVRGVANTAKATADDAHTKTDKMTKVTNTLNTLIDNANS